MNGVAGSVRSGPIAGWSRAPIAARLPAILLVAALCLAALVRPLAPYVFVAVLFLYLVSRRRDEGSMLLAAVVPAAAILVWRAIPQPLADAGGADCANLLAPPAVWRFLEAALGLVAVVGLAIDRRASLAELGLRRGTRNVFLVAVLGLFVITPIALYTAARAGETGVGGMFFGAFRIDITQPLALLPAVLFAASNALAEELAYRGALRVWLVPSLGVLGANLAQAVVFGFAHTGEDFVGVEAAVPTMAAMVLVGFIGGVIARRTGSLAIPLAVHLAADVPIYYYWACRVA